MSLESGLLDPEPEPPVPLPPVYVVPLCNIVLVWNVPKHSPPFAVKVYPVPVNLENPPELPSDPPVVAGLPPAPTVIVYVKSAVGKKLVLSSTAPPGPPDPGKLLIDPPPPAPTTSNCKILAVCGLKIFRLFTKRFLEDSVLAAFIDILCYL
jgi:hypothetical protein